MRGCLSALYSIAVALWVGGLLAIGYLVAPVLFSQLADRSVAGTVAGAMFSVMAWVGLACGTYLIALSSLPAKAGVPCSQAFSGSWC